MGGVSGLDGLLSDPEVKQKLLEQCRDVLERLRKANSDQAGRVDSLWTTDHFLYRNDDGSLQGFWKGWSLLALCTIVLRTQTIRTASSRLRSTMSSRSAPRAASTTVTRASPMSWNVAWNGSATGSGPSR